MSDNFDEQTPRSSPYRMSDVLELTVALEEKNRELDRLRAHKRRGRVAVVVALAVAVVHVAVFSGVLMLRYVPKEIPAAPLPPPEPASCPSAIEPQIVPAVATTGPVVAPPVDQSEADRATLLQQLGGDDHIKPLATEITHALLADPVLARNGRIAMISREKLEILVREQLAIALGADDQTQSIDPSTLAWDAQVTHQEWKAIFDDVEKVFAKHDVDESERATFRAQFSANETTATEEIPRKRSSLYTRASIALSCPESSLTSKELESADSRAVTGCKKGAIYNYAVDPITSVNKWTLEPAVTPSALNATP